MRELKITKELAQEIAKAWEDAESTLKRSGLKEFEFYEVVDDDEFIDRYFTVDLSDERYYLDLCITEENGSHIDDKYLSQDFYIFEKDTVGFNGVPYSLDDIYKIAES